MRAKRDVVSTLHQHIRHLWQRIMVDSTLQALVVASNAENGTEHIWEREYRQRKGK